VHDRTMNLSSRTLLMLLKEEGGLEFHSEYLSFKRRKAHRGAEDPEARGALLH